MGERAGQSGIIGKCHQTRRLGRYLWVASLIFTENGHHLYAFVKSGIHSVGILV